MTHPTRPGVHKRGVLPMGLADRPGEPLGRARCKNEMDVVGHRTICPHLDRGGAATLCEQIAIDRLIARFEEDRRKAVATLRHVVREAWDDDAPNAPHAHTLAALD